MLTEIYCEEFQQKTITFTNTLNVILGTDTGDNSIGKSTFMLIVDFAFGGSTYGKVTDILDNVGVHDIYFKFTFGQEEYSFKRNNTNDDVVWICDQNRSPQYVISLKEYCMWLSEKYGLKLPQLTFRDAVGRYIRAYGKGNCDEKQPLHYFTKEPGDKAVVALLKLFDRYKIISDLEMKASQSNEMLKTYNKAQEMNFVSKIGKREYSKNIDEIKKLHVELDEIALSLENQLLDIDVMTSEKAIQLKKEISRAKRLRSSICSKIATIDENGNYAFSKSNGDYAALAKYFPQINVKHLEEIEAFHEKVASIFKKDLDAERKKLLGALFEYDSIIHSYEVELNQLIQNPHISKAVLQRHADVLGRIEKIQSDNEAYLRSEDLKAQKKEDKERLVNVKSEQLGEIENEINIEMKRLNDLLYHEEHSAPLIHFPNSGYSFITPNDTGTGIAYKGLVVFDLAILHLTRLPVVVHDSVVLKQISDDAIENIMNQYIASGKQTIIALDKQSSYSQATAEILEKFSILKLAPNGQELFGRSWGKKQNT